MSLKIYKHVSLIQFLIENKQTIIIHHIIIQGQAHFILVESNIVVSIRTEDSKSAGQNSLYTGCLVDIIVPHVKVAFQMIERYNTTDYIYKYFTTRGSAPAPTNRK